MPLLVEGQTRLSTDRKRWNEEANIVEAKKCLLRNEKALVDRNELYSH